MVLRLDPEVPVLWRGPHALQLGWDGRVVVLDPAHPADEAIVAALGRGAPISALEVLAGERGLDRDRAARRVEELLRMLGPHVLETAAVDDPSIARIAVHGETPLARDICRALGAEGMLASHADALAGAATIGLTVLVMPWHGAPALAAPWLRRDLAHLPVVQSGSRVAVGPVVLPGRTACLYCQALTRTDADPAWPILAAQLAGRRLPALRPLAAADATAFVARAALEAASAIERGEHDPTRLTKDLDTGEVSAEGAGPHPGCGCGAHPESDWARADAPVSPRPPTARPTRERAVGERG